MASNRTITSFFRCPSKQCTGSLQVDSGMLNSQYRLFQNDTTLDFQYELSGKDNVKFWCQLHGGEEYRELSLLALFLLVISPTSVLCERGFSVMNYEF